ncbi:glycoside hydrolase family 16 protein [Muribaculum intestinale]|uniref:glycoside hydrolase family 16 protein n=1 Tax=Muribaculum intestinale TaxID=1796646 RepID=UPI0025AA25A2|nr:glycoside hydrolase family 16 protein [Muribaculum intestinale]
MNVIKSTHLLLAICLSAHLTGCGSDNDEQPGQSVIDRVEEVVFFDDFTSFNSAYWTKETHEAGWTNQELQSYETSQVTIGKDGDKSVLILTAKRTGDNIVSGRVNSKNKKSFKHGKIEASIKIPATANGLWPAFWMMGNNNREWPACGEIDIMEMGDAQGIASATTTTRVNTAIHYGADVASHEQQYHASDAVGSLQDGNYHTYALLWHESNLEIFIDGNKFHSFDITGNPYFNDSFYLLFNLAVGGVFTGINDIGGITALTDGESASMYIDWVRVTR